MQKAGRETGPERHGKLNRRLKPHRRQLPSGPPGRAATRRHGNLPESLHDNHFYGGAALLLLQTDFRDYRSLSPGHVPRWHPVQRKSKNIVPTELAAAKRREVRPQSVVRGEDVIFCQIPDHSTASAGLTTDPVNVDPVVPVSWTL
jgi:hypothetical protein